MEKAILKTLNYADIFDYPLKAWEIHKWLISTPAGSQDVEKALSRLLKKDLIGEYKDFYFLKNKKRLVKKRLERLEYSKKYLFKATILSQLLKIVPWIKLVGVSGGLGMNNADKSDDIDLFIVTDNKRIWLSRIFAVFALDALNVRRKVNMSDKLSAGKICLNLILEESKVFQETQNLFVAHEVLQMKVLWSRENIYSQYLEQNSWAFEFLPNWATGNTINNSKPKKSKKKILQKTNLTLDVLEILAKRFQLKIMQKPKGQERVTEGALYFHPNDYQKEILAKYKQKIISTP